MLIRVSSFMRKAHLLLFFTVVQARSQTIPLSGNIAIQNSKYETGMRQFVPGASVRAPFAKPVASDNNGNFLLETVGAAKGTAIRVSVVKPGMEVVNNMDLEAVVLGRQVPIRIVMAEAGKLADAQARFHSINTEFILRTYESRMARLRDTSVAVEERLARISQQAGDTLAGLGDAIVMLTDQRDAALSRVAELAHSLAVVDLDEASQRYRDAYALVGSGRFEEAVALLDQDRLDKDMALAIASKQRGGALVDEANQDIARLVDSYSLKAQILETSLRFQDALLAMNESQRIMDEQPDAFTAEELITARGASGRMLCTLGEYTDAVRVLEAALQEARSDLPRGSAAFVALYNGLSLAMAELGEYPIAVQYADTGSRLAIATFGVSDVRSGELFYQLGQSQLKAGDYATARMNFNRAWTTWEHALEPTDPRLGKALGSIGMTHYREGGLDSAVYYNERSVEQLRLRGSNDDPGLLAALSNYAVMLADMDRMERSLAQMTEARIVAERIYGMDHPYTAQIWANIASVLEEVERPDSALALYTMAKKSLERSLGADHPMLAIIHGNMAAVYENLGQLPMALEETRMAQQIMVKEAGADHPDMPIIYNSMGTVFSTMEVPDSALRYFDLCISAVEKNFGPDHLDALLCHLNHAKTLIDVGLYDEAIAELALTRDRAQRVLGEQAGEYIGSLVNLGSAYLYKVEPDSALRFLDDALAHMRALPDGRTPNMAQVQRDRSNAFRIKKDAIQARAAADSSLAILLDAVGPDHYLTGLSHQERAHVHVLSAEYDQAAIHLDEALRIARGSNSARTASASEVLLEIGKLDLLRGDTTSAVDRLNGSIAELPSANAEWELYAVSLARGNKVEALHHLVGCARLQRSASGVRPTVWERTRVALHALAIELNRTDVVKEFQLE